MTWFNYTSGSTTQYPSVRRIISFPFVTEKLKSGDWLHVNLGNLDIGRLYYYENGLIKNKADSDSYIVVYENGNAKTVTHSLILGDLDSPIYQKNLWFKSVSNVEPGYKPDGNYYIYYHKDNIQYLQFNAGNYISTTPPSGANFIALNSGTGTSSINYYSTEIVGDSNNSRVAALTYLGDTTIWSNQKTSTVGSKILGTFTGPKLKIFGDKSPNSGIVVLKIIKTSATGSGQVVVKSGIEIDLFSSNVQENQLIYSIDMQELSLFSTYDELYGNFNFEIELLSKKNQSSFGNDFKIIKYSFSKNFELQIGDEEIKSDIAFKSTGGVK
jgi:hypothetical protein